MRWRSINEAKAIKFFFPFGVIRPVLAGGVIRNSDVNLNNTTAVGHGHFELVTIDINSFTTRRQVTKRLHHQTTDGIDLFVTKAGAEGFIEVFDRRERANRPCGD